MAKLTQKFSGPFSWRERQLGIEAAEASGKIYDLCVIGGGITGAAIARDASLRGLSVLLVEKDDFAYGTSSRSSKLVHGGVRYLEQYEFKLVMESTRERARLWRLAPELVTPLPFLFPAFKKSRVPLWKLNIGLWLYDILSLFRGPGLHKRYSKEKTLAEEPGLRSTDLTGSIFYWDGATNDALLTLSNIIDAYTNGANPLSRVLVEGVQWNPAAETSPTEAHEIALKDVLGQRSFKAHARVVVSATGPWTDSLLNVVKFEHSRLLAPTRGSHIVVSQKRLPSRHAIVIFHPKDGRVLFSIPWDESTIIGTTDLFDRGSADGVTISPSEVDYLIEAANDYFPKAHLKRDDVISTWSGLRPLLAPPEDASASKISREHYIHFHNPGLLIICGGKLTTHREMAEQALDKIYEGVAGWKVPLSHPRTPTLTHDRPLPLCAFPSGNPARLGESEASRISVADIEGMCRSQMVLSLEDLLVRRTSIYYKEPHNGWLLLPKLKDVLCRELNWDNDEWQRQVEGYRSHLHNTILAPLGRDLPNV